MLANLDSGTIFKKAFTDKFVFEQFIQDILGFKVTVGKIETEKQFEPKIGRIAFELDIFAETQDKRMIIELQKIEYDYNFDRFLHYFLMMLAEQQKSSKEYKIKRNVYLILIMTQPYEKLFDLEDKLLNQEKLVTTLHTEDSGHDKVPLYAHKFITLNPNHKHKETPKEVRDWLDLIYESINHPETPNINRLNPGINKAAELIDFENLTDVELAAKKRDEASKTTKKLYEQIAAEKATQKERDKNIRMLAQNGVSINLLTHSFGLTEEEINQILLV